MKCKGKILYVGGFQLPDLNAAALRVVSNAKALREIGYEVCFFNTLNNYSQETQVVDYYGFKTLNCKKENIISYMFSCGKIIREIEKVKPDIIIAYNYPSFALMRLIKYCKEKNIKCLGDVTEWYVPKGNIVYRIVKGFDSEFRMRFVHKKMDGIIAISEYLYSYYKDSVNTVKIPPLIDLAEDKWQGSSKKETDCIRLIYAGTPSPQKERLDLIINNIENLETSENVFLDIVGITLEEYERMYSSKYNGKRVKFWGRLSNKEVVKMTKSANWSIILRDNNKVVKAGFPTKVPESIACGTPIIANRFSNIEEYLNDSNSILYSSVDELAKISMQDLMKSTNVQKDVFNYTKYLNEFNTLLNIDI